MRDSAPAPTSLRGGRYAVQRILGEGSQGATFEGVDTRDGRRVAIKRFSVRGATSWKEVELAEREARVLADLAPHPSLPRYVEHFEEGDELYLVTQLIEGESLAARRKPGGVGSAARPAREDDVLRFLRDAGAALEHLHALHPALVHRDIKPSNVICRPDGSFALIDFGSVRDRLKPEGGSTVVGTFGFMAPEQFQGRALPVSDIYATGATAIAWLTGREPEDLPHRGLAIDVKRAVAGLASPELTRALTAMLEPDPDRRATRIGPLLPATRDGRAERTSRQAAPREQPETRGARVEPQRVKHAERRADHARERAQRAVARAERAAQRAEKYVPHVVVLFLSLGLTIAQVAVILATRVVVPIVLTVLSVVFGAGLRRAAKAVSAGGDRAQASIAHARDVILAQGSGAARAHFDEAHRESNAGAGTSGGRVRVDPAEQGEIRVEVHAPAEGDGRLASDDETPSSRRRARSH